jgi:hypothetical protein
MSNTTRIMGFTRNDTLSNIDFFNGLTYNPVEGIYCLQQEKTFRENDFIAPFIEY